MSAYKPNQILAALRVMVLACRPVFLSGAPGIGKSHVFRTLAASMGRELRDVRATLLDAVDLRGLPVIDKASGMTRWFPPAFLPTEGEGILFLDELNAAAPSVQTACLQLILDRRLGEYELPKGWVAMAAGNRVSDGATATRMSSALSNRFVHLEMETDVDDWSSWALSAGVDPVLIAFMRFRPNLLHAHSTTERAYPTPRSWEFVSEILKAGVAERMIELALIEGAVGQGAATEFAAFLDLYRKLPNIYGIILNPNAGDVPNDPATRYAVTYALASRATGQSWRNVLAYFDRLPEEYAVLGVKHATTRDTSLANTTEFTKWAVAHAHILS
jgi:hypothetical protein